MPRDPELTRRISDSLARNGGDKTAVARELKIARQTVIDHARLADPDPDPDPDPEPDAGSTKFVEAGDQAEVEFSTGHRIRTVEDAIKYGQIDTKVWRVDRFEVTSWEQGMKVQVVGPDGKRLSDTPKVQTLWRVALKLKRLLPKPYLDATEALFDRLKAVAPASPRTIYRKPTTPHLLVAALNDVHFGKLAWARETGEDYDLRIAERLFKDAVEDILARSHGYGIEKIAFPVGNDFFHVDGITNQTTNGTPQDTDGRYHKMIEVGEMALIWAVDACRSVAPVEVIHVPGNHDRIASWHACRTLSARFHRCPDVTVDTEPKTRKYNLYGKTLLGFVHGCDEKVSSLPAIMAAEVPDLWAASQYREWIGGHWHSSKQTQFNPVSTHDGVRYRSTLSLSGRDAWHARKGYLGGKRAAEAFLFCRETGDVHSFEVSMRAAG